ncbi:hypothetical protein [Chitinolyticbacter meiyuanensis]|uniref:hypothetical protein n=1 Tax=Chitinolyticbacter meiyuanensis TaxID=682798 RepID=UPI0011E59930|nr:hypothetical protein [Chitinolyticbacter meiyuanensis]
MPYVQRGLGGEITALYAQPHPGAEEFVPHASPDVLAFLGQAEDRALFGELDIEFVRVIEDLIDVLIQKNVFKLTDLPPQAQAKLLARQRLRKRLNGPSLLGSGNDVI